MLILIEFEKKSLCFESPLEIISCHEPLRLKESFERIEEFLAKGYYVAGFLSYEAGYAFEEKLFERNRYDFPLLLMGCFAAPAQKTFRLSGRENAKIMNISENMSYAHYAADIQQIRHHIAEGDVYQITYCLKKLFSFTGNPLDLYRTLLSFQPVPYPAYLDCGEYQILSLSPELFIKKEGTRVITKPMKGTWPRGKNWASDFLASFRLKYDTKNRAENIMIADLLRNDLGRIGCGVRAPSLFDVAGYHTLYQMTSTVTAKVDQDVAFYDLFKAIFPSGSVTGAPKIRAMQIIKELEQEERKIYTGAIGYFSPNKDLFFNVPIRTLLLQHGRGEMGIGGGIVWDSTPEGEWQEGLLKARFLQDFMGKR